MRRLKCPGHSDCAQIATWWPPDDAMARVPREVPRDRGTRVHTPSHCPGASFGSPPQGAALADRTQMSKTPFLGSCDFKYGI